MLYLRVIVKQFRSSLGFVLLLIASSASAQELTDSASWGTELEDSISGMSIRPIMDSESLVDSIICQLVDAWEHPSKGNDTYRYEYRIYKTKLSSWRSLVKPRLASELLESKTYKKAKPPQKIIKFVAKGTSSIKQVEFKNADIAKYIFKGRRRLSPKDSSWLKYSNYAEGDYVFSLLEDISITEKMSTLAAFRRLLREYHVKVFSITDEANRGVFRIDFAPKKKLKLFSHFSKQYGYYKFTGAAYFNAKTLLLESLKGSRVLTVYPESVYFEIDYESQDGRPVIRQLKTIQFDENELASEIKVQKYRP